MFFFLSSQRFLFFKKVAFSMRAGLFLEAVGTDGNAIERFSHPE